MEKGGLKSKIKAGLETLGKVAKGVVAFGDEMRFGLLGQVRRVLAPKGVKIVQRLQREYVYEYLFLSIIPKEGKLKWSWIPRMKQEHLKPTLESWNLDIMVWDGTGAHRGQAIAHLPGQRLIQPAYSPELNPGERVFQEIRRAIEGLVYPSLLDKRHAVDDFLTKLAANPDAVKRLCFWHWIEQSLCVTSS
jgi:transposase